MCKFWSKKCDFNQIIAFLRYILGARSRKYRTKGVLRGDSRCAVPMQSVRNTLRATVSRCRIRTDNRHLCLETGYSPASGSLAAALVFLLLFLDSLDEVVNQGDEGKRLLRSAKAGGGKKKTTHSHREQVVESVNTSPIDYPPWST